MIVSLEAIFLSTFVLISQNRADEKRVMLADTEWQLVQDEAHQNEQRISISEEILLLTRAIRPLVTPGGEVLLPSSDALQAGLVHQSGHPVPTDRDPFPVSRRHTLLTPYTE